VAPRCYIAEGEEFHGDVSHLPPRVHFDGDRKLRGRGLAFERVEDPCGGSTRGMAGRQIWLSGGGSLPTDRLRLCEVGHLLFGRASPSRSLPSCKAEANMALRGVAVQGTLMHYKEASTGDEPGREDNPIHLQISSAFFFHQLHLIALDGGREVHIPFAVREGYATHPDVDARLVAHVCARHPVGTEERTLTGRRVRPLWWGGMGSFVIDKWNPQRERRLIRSHTPPRPRVAPEPRSRCVPPPPTKEGLDPPRDGRRVQRGPRARGEIPEELGAHLETEASACGRLEVSMHQLEDEGVWLHAGLSTRTLEKKYVPMYSNTTLQTSLLTHVHFCLSAHSHVQR